MAEANSPAFMYARMIANSVNLNDKRTQKVLATSCPYCAGQKVSKENNLKFLFPEIAKEWHYEKNYPHKPEDLTKSSGKKVWWLCSNGHEWKTAVQVRTGKKKSNCPYCGNHYTIRKSK